MIIRCRLIIIGPLTSQPTLSKSTGDLRKLRRRQQGERQKSNRFNEQNNNSARASRFFVHFFAVPAQLRREITTFQVHLRTGTAER